MGENRTKTKKKKDKSKPRKKPEQKSKLKINLRKYTFFSYEGPSRHIEFVAILFVLCTVNVVAEFTLSGFPYGLAALALCMGIIAVVAILLKTKMKQKS